MNSKFKFFIDILLTISFLICFITGFMGGHGIHSLTGYITFFLVIVHIFIHFKGIKSFFIHTSHKDEKNKNERR
jgi:hypothetical protein